MSNVALVNTHVTLPPVSCQALFANSFLSGVVFGSPLCEPAWITLVCGIAWIYIVWPTEDLQCLT